MNHLHGSTHLYFQGAHITTSWEFVTPEMAKDWQSRGVERERKIRHHRVESLKADMNAGRFVPSPNGLAFDSDGNRIDGQHRLEAIIQSGVGQLLLVTRGLKPEWREVIDSGLVRSLPDAVSETWINTTTTATARRMIVGANRRGGGASFKSRATELDFMRTHREAICFAATNDLGRIMGAGTRAAIAVAYYSVDREVLAEFRAGLLGEFVADPARGVLIAKFVKHMTDTVVPAGEDAARVAYLKTQRAIKAFVEKEALTRFAIPSASIYTLP